MQAILLAAGMGKRLQAYTKDNTKCMVRVNGVTLVERLMRILDRKGLSRIIIVTGYQGQKLRDYVDSLQLQTPIVYIDNPIYDKTNNIYSLSLAQDYLASADTLLFESDLIFDEMIVDKLIADERPTLAVVDRFESWMDGTCMILDEDDSIIDFVPGKYVDYLGDDEYYKTVNIYKFSSVFSANTYIPFLEAYRKSVGENEYYESVIKLISLLPTNELKAMRLDGEIWYEIDDVQDLDIAESLFADSPSDKYDKLSSRYGGYWRYPKLLDFCYLVNPFFPPRRMVEEIEASIDTLLRDYPSGMSVNSLLAARNFGVDPDHIVVGNGAAELIKALMERPDLGTIGIIRPTFEEYPNRYDPSKVVVYTSDRPGYRYDEVDIISYFESHHIDTLVLINPDNPSGNYITYDGVDRIIKWTADKGIRFILDESFVDFEDADPVGTHMIDDVLTAAPHLILVKSISKSYGVPGLRLGVIACGDTSVIEDIKRDVSIWNINSLAEYYMQIYEKYSKQYEASLKNIKMCRKRMFDDLKRIPGIEVFPSQANYLMCRLPDGVSSAYVAEELLTGNILVKDLTHKISDGRQYLRLAVRDYTDNALLVRTLESLLNNR